MCLSGKLQRLFRSFEGSCIPGSENPADVAASTMFAFAAPFAYTESPTEHVRNAFASRDLMISIIAGVVIFIVAAVLIAVQRGLQMRRLAENGVPATATVERLWGHTGATGMSRRRMRYTFRAGDGREYARAIMISSGERDRMQEGGTVAVIYLRDNPKISALAESVELARRALKK